MWPLLLSLIGWVVRHPTWHGFGWRAVTHLGEAAWRLKGHLFG
jgi:hypothetical protein